MYFNLCKVFIENLFSDFINILIFNLFFSFFSIKIYNFWIDSCFCYSTSSLSKSRFENILFFVFISFRGSFVHFRLRGFILFSMIEMSSSSSVNLFMNLSISPSQTRVKGYSEEGSKGTTEGSFFYFGCLRILTRSECFMPLGF